MNEAAEVSIADPQQTLGLAQRLVAALQDGDSSEARTLIDELTAIRETELFRELGNLTRELHDALKTFQMDPRITDVVTHEFPDARTRLTHVIDMTEQAAHRTLNAIDTSLPLVGGLTDEAVALAEQWGRLRSRQLSAAEFRSLSRQIDDYLQRVGVHGAQVQQALSDALMAQGYQDLTGQIIRRVITLVQEVEASLVGLMRVSGPRMTPEPRLVADTDEDAGRKVQGPAIQGHDQGVVHGQDEVDDLLSSLGF